MKRKAAERILEAMGPGIARLHRIVTDECSADRDAIATMRLLAQMAGLLNGDLMEEAAESETIRGHVPGSVLVNGSKSMPRVGCAELVSVTRYRPSGTVAKWGPALAATT